MNNTVIILRGVSGCGKTTAAEYLKGIYNYRHDSNDVVICTADDFFMDFEGKYKFNPNLLMNAHADCLRRFKRGVDGDYPLVILANTNAKERDFKTYIDYAEEKGYTVFSLVVENRHGGKNSHNVPEASLEKQEANIRLGLKLR